MIIRIMSSGRSFKGLAQYLCHDVQANTAERVAWTQSLNCAHDDEQSVVHEMYTTMLDADLLKEEAGGRAGYGPLKKPVKHVSLSWHESDEPTPEHMRETTEAFLKHMGWDEHQAFIVAHNDKDHQHLHVMLNAIHPETGLKLDDRFEKRRAQEWGLEYERSQDRIHCEQRLRPSEEREPEMSRDAWQAMKDAEARETGRLGYDPGYMAKEERREIIIGEEWGILKDHQRQEREAFMAENSALYRDARKEAYREVKEEMQDEWSAYYAAKRSGASKADLSVYRQNILQHQTELMSERVTAAFAEVRDERNDLYNELKAEHREARADLRDRQSEGLSSPHLLNLVNRDPGTTFEQQPFAPQQASERPQDAFTIGTFSLGEGTAPARQHVSLDHEHTGDRAASGFADRGASIRDGLFSESVAEATAVSPRSEARSENPFSRVAETARRHVEKEEQEEQERSYTSYTGRTRD